VKTFREGWGFVICDQVQGDIYANVRNSPMMIGLNPGDPVEFDIVFRAEATRNNGFQAVNVQPCRPVAW
jgi:cold shock CspA family protein